MKARIENHKNMFLVYGVALLIGITAMIQIGSVGIGYAQAQSGPTEVAIAAGSADPSNAEFYVPPEVQVSSNSTVKWTNEDNTIHTVTQGNPAEASASSEPQFDSGFMQVGGTFEYTFAEAGTVDYYCTLHPWMTGKVTVA
jgi:plastocyanin